MPWSPVFRVFWWSHFRTFVPSRCRDVAGTWTCMQHPMWSPVPHTHGELIPQMSLPKVQLAKDTSLVNHSPATSRVLLKVWRHRLVGPFGPFRMMPWSPGLQMFWRNHFRSSFPGCDVAMSPCGRNLDVHTTPDAIPGPSYLPSPINSSNVPLP